MFNLLTNRSGILGALILYFTALSFLGQNICADVPTGERGTEEQCLIDTPTEIDEPGTEPPGRGGDSDEVITVFGVEIPGTQPIIQAVQSAASFTEWLFDQIGVLFSIFALDLDTPTWFNIAFVIPQMFVLVGILISYLLELLSALIPG